LFYAGFDTAWSQFDLFDLTAILQTAKAEKDELTKMCVCAWLCHI